MNKVLFIIPAYNTNRPQAVRFKNIIPYLKNKFEIHILYPSEVRKYKFFEKEGINFHEIKGSLLGHFINPFYYNKFYFPNSKILKLLRNACRFLFRSILFPDLFTIELQKLKKEIKRLHKIHNYNSVVISCAPFALLKLGPSVKNISKDFKWVVDIGDPFYKNNLNKYPIQKMFAESFESKYLRFVDDFIVTNKATADHYKTTFSSSISSNKIHIIEHGTSISDNGNYEIEIKWGNKIIISYVGIFYKKLREPFELYEAIKLINKFNNIKIELNVYGPIHKYFKKLNQKELYQNIHFHGPTSHEKVADIYTASNFVLLIDNAFGFQTPGKVFELIATQKPILFLYENPNSAILAIMKKYEGALIMENNKACILEKFNRILKKDCFSFKTNFDLKPYSWSNLSNEFCRILR